MSGVRQLSAPFEELDGALVLFGGGSAAEGAEVTSSSGARINFPGVQPVLIGLELSDHALFPAVRLLPVHRYTKGPA